MQHRFHLLFFLSTCLTELVSEGRRLLWSGPCFATAIGGNKEQGNLFIEKDAVDLLTHRTHEKRSAQGTACTLKITAELSSDVLSHLAAEMLVPSAHRNGKIKSITCPMHITVSGFATVEAKPHALVGSLIVGVLQLCRNKLPCRQHMWLTLNERQAQQHST